MATQSTSTGNSNLGFVMENISSTIEGIKDNCQIAIRVQNADKSYGNKKIIENLNMTVLEGSIYALLGASGSGKTTILNAILGQKKLDSGSIEIFGYPTGSIESGIPGSRVGLMPQELSLFEEFTIREILYYFGRIYGMSKEKIQEKTDFLVKLLKIPLNTDTLIRNLSGGQKRRISFAVSLIHDGQILILDEPTVGVDPILRKCIWEYLCDLAINQKVTIVITTHYIEEAESANIIGIMRNGRILVEESPRNLLSQYNEHNFSEIVLKISQKDENNEIIPEINPDPHYINRIKKSKKISWADKKSNFLPKIQALVFRNFIKMWRNFAFVFLLLVVPGCGIATFTLSFLEFKNMEFGIVNSENNGSICPENVENYCQTNYSGCQFLNLLPKEKLKITEYSSVEDAVEDIKKGKSVGCLKIIQNFSKIIQSSGKEIVTIPVEVDNTNKIIMGEIKEIIETSLKEFNKFWITNCSKEKKTKLDFKIENHDMIQPIFPDEDGTFVKYFSPGFYLDIILFVGILQTCMLLILEKEAGMYERSIVAGVTQMEIIFSHFLTQLAVVIIQVFGSLLMLFGIFGLSCKGSFLLIILLAILAGSAGIHLGFLLAAFCSQQSTIILIVLAIKIPAAFVSGIFWPLEGVPYVFRYISIVFPETLASEAFRSIISRGWGITHPGVYPGILVLFLIYNVLIPLMIYVLYKFKII